MSSYCWMWHKIHPCRNIAFRMSISGIAIIQPTGIVCKGVPNWAPYPPVRFQISGVMSLKQI